MHGNMNVKYINLISSITGMNNPKIIIVIITVILSLPLSHYVIGLCFLQSPLPDSVF